MVRFQLCLCHDRVDFERRNSLQLVAQRARNLELDLFHSFVGFHWIVK